ncbi:hypothetical protein BOTBODRAFT_175860 [Botryobasidium botryosum FD-172 SS1]|uniref:Uncharacterized protein n=1 Tax=Botryobasidium botryosum (strain FD-172 SS1) TaxID=930990 RepID=A0A067MB43_BOTB1|nr:hypothetical protein BOTBODRAFT_175860 [Botryobasidium botryosum FD-172 SS1]
MNLQNKLWLGESVRLANFWPHASFSSRSPTFKLIIVLSLLRPRALAPSLPQPSFSPISNILCAKGQGYHKAMGEVLRTMHPTARFSDASPLPIPHDPHRSGQMTNQPSPSHSSRHLPRQVYNPGAIMTATTLE